MEKTLSMIKPEAVGRGLSGKIIAAIEESGLKVVAQKMLRLSREQAARFYAVHQNKAFFDELIENITAGPVIVQVLAGENAIEEYRRLMGNTNPAAAEEGTLRRLYGVSIEKTPSTVQTAPKLPNGKSPFSSIGWKFWNNLRRLLMRRLFLPVLLFVLFTVFSARAGQPSYSADVTVDVTADNASAARELAMRRANRQAVSAIAANFTTREGVTVLNKLTDDQLLNFIRETTVLEEKTSNVRYLAKLRITANDKILRQYLQEKNVPLVVASSAEVMVIPVFREGPDMPALLWETESPWRAAWQQNPPTVGSVRFFMPTEDAAPFLTSAEQALGLDAELFGRLSSLNGGGDVYVAEAYYNGDDALAVSIINPRNGKRQIFSVGGPRTSELFNQAARETGMRIADELKGRTVVTSTEPETITVLYKFKTLSSWLKTEEKIAAVTAVEDIRINAIGNGRIQFQISYVGDLDTLAGALRSARLLLSETGGYFTLTDM